MSIERASPPLFATRYRASFPPPPLWKSLQLGTAPHSNHQSLFCVLTPNGDTSERTKPSNSCFYPFNHSSSSHLPPFFLSIYDEIFYHVQVGELKSQIQSMHPASPHCASQKLIYKGKLLPADNAVLGSVLTSLLEPQVGCPLARPLACLHTLARAMLNLH